MIVSSALLFLACVVKYCCANSSPPHIVIAIADDLGWSDLGFQNISGIRTPHIDKLARSGIILDNHYVQPLCSPSRASLLTGRYPIHLGDGLNENVFSPDEDVGLSLNETLLPEKLKELGYNTALFGKWHLGHSRVGYLPTRRGFDRFYGFYTGAIDYYYHNQTASRCKCAEKNANFLDFRDQEEIVRDRKGEYSSAIFNEKAVEYIEEQGGKKPLFLVMSYQNVHDPLQVPTKYSSMYNHIAEKDRRTYAGMASYLDDSVHVLTETLKKRAMWKNTVFLFMSDNGGNPSSAGYNWPLRGAKGTLWEGGIRSVSFLSGGFLSEPGIKSNALVHVTDWFPTLLNLAKSRLPVVRRRPLRRDSRNSISIPVRNLAAEKKMHQNDVTVDGFDLWNVITLQLSKSPRQYILHNINSHSYAVRKGDWKLISEIDMGWLPPPEGTGKSAMNPRNRPLDPKAFTGYLLDPKLPRIIKGLYNMRTDRCEKHDVSDNNTEVVKELFGIIKKYKRSMLSHERKYRCNMKAIEKANDKNAWGPFSA